MKLVITSHNLGLWAASYICHRWQTANKRPFVLGLPTGGTVEEMYAALSGLVKNGKMSFQDIVSFNMDEYVGLAPQHEQSYHYYMQYHLFSHVEQIGGIDLFLGGVGRNGHLAFNEPGSAFDSRTRVIELTQDTILANSRFFDNDPSKVPTRALSVGIGTVLAAKEVFILACGSSKAKAVAQAAQGEITTQWPITALRTHNNATLLVDEAAAAELDPNILARFRAASKEGKDLVLTF